MLSSRGSTRRLPPAADCTTTTVMAIGTDQPVTCPDVIGRARELAFLDRVLGDATRGVGQVVLLRGEAGIGKTRLIASTKASASQAGYVVLESCCFEPDRRDDSRRGHPWRPVQEIVSRFLERPPVGHYVGMRAHAPTSAKPQAVPAVEAASVASRSASVLSCASAEVVMLRRSMSGNSVATVSASQRACGRSAPAVIAPSNRNRGAGRPAC